MCMRWSLAEDRLSRFICMNMTRTGGCSFSSSPPIIQPRSQGLHCRHRQRDLGMKLPIILSLNLKYLHSWVKTHEMQKVNDKENNKQEI